MTDPSGIVTAISLSVARFTTSGIPASVTRGDVPKPLPKIANDRPFVGTTCGSRSVETAWMTTSVGPITRALAVMTAVRTALFAWKRMKLKPLLSGTPSVGMPEFG